MPAPSRSAVAARVRRALCADRAELAEWMRRQRRVITQLKFALSWRYWYLPRVRAILAAPL